MDQLDGISWTFTSTGTATLAKSCINECGTTQSSHAGAIF
jgi:hypothetical protein